MTDPKFDPCGHAGEYTAGHLDVEQERRFLAHLVGCATCQADLAAGTQLEALEAEAQKLAPRPRVRRRRTLLVGAAFGLVAAAAATVVMLRADHPPVQVAIAVAPARSLEGRLSHPAADTYRPYGVERSSGGPGGEPVAPEAIAELARRKDQRGLFAAYALSGAWASAEALALAAGDPDAASDRAAVALARGDAAAALRFADAALAVAPEHAQAHWNRGLALRELGLPLGAAEELGRLAVGADGWAKEARVRAEALRAPVVARRDAWNAVREAGLAMATGGPVLDAATARRLPGITRLYFYDALRTAGSAARVQELAPLAAELDRVAGGTVLTDKIRAAGQRDFARRAPFAAEYLKMMAYTSGLAGAELEAWLLAARKAGADDVVQGALQISGQIPAHLELFRGLAAGDPWFEHMADGQQAAAAEARGERAAALELRLRLAERCADPAATGVVYRCLVNDLAIVDAELSELRLGPAETRAREALARARAAGEWSFELEFLSKLARVERWRVEQSFARAAFEELAGASSYPCLVAEARGELATLALLDRRPVEAKRQVESMPRCDQPGWEAGVMEIAARVDLSRQGVLPAALAQITPALAAMRARGGSEGLYADVLEGRLVIDGEPARGRELLVKTRDAALASADPEAPRVRAYAEQALVADAGKRAAWTEALTFMAPEGAEACSLAIAWDDDRLTVIARGPDGGLTGSHTTGKLTASELVPAPAAAALAACPVVHVLADPTLTGRSDLLPPERAFAFRLRGVRPALAANLPARRVVVGDAEPPAALGLPRLAALAGEPPGALVLRGPAANPGRVLAEAHDATLVEIHAHGLVDRRYSEVPLLALSLSGAGTWALTAEAVEKTPLAGAPVVVLADCGAGAVAPYLHDAWGLPAAFLRAGARAVIAPTHAVPDGEAGEFFAALADRLQAGVAPAEALAALRRAFLSRPGHDWVRDVHLFE